MAPSESLVPIGVELPCTLGQVPPEMLHAIIGKLPLDDLLRLACASRIMLVVTNRAIKRVEQSDEALFGVVDALCGAVESHTGYSLYFRNLLIEPGKAAIFGRVGYKGQYTDKSTRLTQEYILTLPIATKITVRNKVVHLLKGLSYKFPGELVTRQIELHLTMTEDLAGVETVTMRSLDGGSMRIISSLEDLGLHTGVSIYDFVKKFPEIESDGFHDADDEMMQSYWTLSDFDSEPDYNVLDDSELKEDTPNY